MGREARASWGLDGKGWERDTAPPLDFAAGDEQGVLGSDEADLSDLTSEVVRPEELNPSQPTEPVDPPATPSRPAIAQAGDETFSPVPVVAAAAGLLALAGVLLAAVRGLVRR